MYYVLWFFAPEFRHKTVILGKGQVRGTGSADPATDVNILGTSHIPNHQCRSDNPRHQEETHIPCCHNGRYRLSPFELWSMERL